jgi:hypothetical protein
LLDREAIGLARHQTRQLVHDDERTGDRGQGEPRSTELAKIRE